MFKRLIRAYRFHGFRKFCWLLCYNTLYVAARLVRPREDTDDDFDRTYGTDTARIREIGSLDISSDNERYAVRYQPTDTGLFIRTLEELQADFSRYSFLDYGCGKGKLLLLASNFPFKRILGVEFSSELAQIADRNITMYRNLNQRCRDISVVCCDAATYRPPAEPLVCYFYNPFGKHVMQNVVARLERSLSKVEQGAFIIYVEPKHADVIDASGAWEAVTSTELYRIYRHQPQG